MQEIQPEIKKIQEKYKNNKQKQGQAMMEFYKKINQSGVRLFAFNYPIDCTDCSLPSFYGWHRIIRQ